MKMTRITALTIALSLTALPGAFAHGPGSRILGTVTAITSNTITVRAEDGDVVPVTVDEATTYRSGADQATLADVVAGARIVIDVGAEPGSTTARSVRVGVARSSTPATKEGACNHAAGSAAGSSCSGTAAGNARGAHDHAQ